MNTLAHATSPSHCWGETYTVDPWANLQTIAATTNSNYTGCSQESGFSKPADGNNHLSGFSYDSSGNTLGDGVNSYAWDGESQLKSAGGVNYLYDGDGRRVSKSSGKLYWYGSGGEILAETDASGNTTNEYVYFGGKRVALLPSGSTAQFYAEDFLGSSRVVTTNTGVVCYDADFYPFGGERTVTNSCAQNNYKFEGKERDTETGNDDFGARYYSNRFGRWLSSDWSTVPVPVPYANLANPQTLNLYAMVADDPETFADLDGHCYYEGVCNTFSGGGYLSDAFAASVYSSRLGIPPVQIIDEADPIAVQVKDKAQNQKPALTVSLVQGQTALGAPVAEAAAGFTVSIQSSSNFPPGDLTVTADLHFDADKKVAKGTSVLLGAAAENTQTKVGGQEAPKTVNSLLVDVRPYNQSGSFGGKPQEPGYIRFTTTDSQGHKQTATLNVSVTSKRIPGGLPLPAGDFNQRLTVPIPNP